ncbi:hypothetical protein BH23PLA1_BH23PLA1_05920 [soil metagenome]
MIGHHRMAITGDDTMEGAEECTGRAAQPGLKRLCGNIVSTQTREIGEMQTLLAQAGGTPSEGGGMGGHGG